MIDLFTEYKADSASTLGWRDWLLAKAQELAQEKERLTDELAVERHAKDRQRVALEAARAELATMREELDALKAMEGTE